MNSNNNNQSLYTASAGIPMPILSQDEGSNTHAVEEVAIEVTSDNDAGTQSLQRIDVPADNNCLFWAVVLSALVPLKANQEAFHQMFARLFGDEQLALEDSIRALLAQYNGDMELFESGSGRILGNLVSYILRQRTADYMRAHRDELLSTYRQLFMPGAGSPIPLNPNPNNQVVKHFRGEDAQHCEQSRFEQEYTSDTLRYLLHIQVTANWVRYICLGTNSSELKQDIAYLNQLKIYLERPAAFICQEPGLVATSHWIAGFWLDNNLLLINPMGMTHHIDFYRMLNELESGELTKHITVYLCKDTFQNHALENDQNCGPLCLAILTALCQQPIAELKELFQQAELPAEASSSTDRAARYPKVSIAHLLMRHPYLQQLSTKPEAEYRQTMLQIRQDHLTQLQSLSDEQVEALKNPAEQQLMLELHAGKSLEALQNSEPMQVIKAQEPATQAITLDSLASEFDQRIGEIRNVHTWGGDFEILALSEMLGLAVNLEVDEASVARPYKNLNVQFPQTIQLIFTSAGEQALNNHYHFQVASRYLTSAHCQPVRLDDISRRKIKQHDEAAIALGVVNGLLVLFDIGLSLTTNIQTLASNKEPSADAAALGITGARILLFSIITLVTIGLNANTVHKAHQVMIDETNDLVEAGKLTKEQQILILDKGNNIRVRTGIGNGIAILPLLVYLILGEVAQVLAGVKFPKTGAWLDLGSKLGAILSAICWVITDFVAQSLQLKLYDHEIAPQRQANSAKGSQTQAAGQLAALGVFTFSNAKDKSKASDEVSKHDSIAEESTHPDNSENGGSKLK